MRAHRRRRRRGSHRVVKSGRWTPGGDHCADMDHSVASCERRNERIEVPHVSVHQLNLLRNLIHDAALANEGSNFVRCMDESLDQSPSQVASRSRHYDLHGAILRRLVWSCLVRAAFSSNFLGLVLTSTQPALHHISLRLIL